MKCRAWQFPAWALEVNKLQSTSDTFCVSLFLVLSGGETSKEEDFTACANHMQFKLRCPQIKFHPHTAVPTHLRVICGRLGGTTAAFSVARETGPQSPKYLLSLVHFRKKKKKKQSCCLCSRGLNFSSQMSCLRFGAGGFTSLSLVYLIR